MVVVLGNLLKSVFQKYVEIIKYQYQKQICSLLFEYIHQLVQSKLPLLAFCLEH